MNVQLLTVLGKCGIESNYLFVGNRWSGYDYEIEYTGRWKIVKENDTSTLYLECFKWIDKKITTKVKTTECKGWWIFKKCCEREIEVDAGTKLSVKNLGWISERYLDVKTTEEFINQCGEQE